ncbi:Uncharacterised protein [Mycobacteroides abscessus subsp. abscessus]|uniref:hypothetical protein n=1 Tax=Mycobacteroides abscessus TaxID=36809 RepID=UPI000929036E|nr:hypothetical protein [Mycobacteroides abscessus]MDM2175301.1 hypothetical protein [Mycobacteroides abscessus]MDM2176313.1 hypothetical protein [Mycobacteroides abscessus]MDM2204878.1 hypothetical protein [Mycobacteroides abscessus]MDM2210463.1 hypothetical protein [Mycobacteroides abscessus]MDM2215797.1 hypothetical protein [Mycobacteroides abscessus]
MRISTIIALGSLAVTLLLGGLSAALGGTATRCTPVQRPRPDGGVVTLQDCAVGAITPGRLFAGIAGLFLLVAVLAGFWAVVSAMTRPMDRALSPTVTAAADSGARAAAAARQAAAARAERRQQQGYAANYGAGAGGYGTGYRDDEVIDAEVIQDYPYTADEYAAPPQPEAPRAEEPQPQGKPTAGWGSSFTFEEE